jgi:hypothetical protein
VYKGREVNPKGLEVIKVSKKSYIPQSGNINQSRGGTHMNHIYRIKTLSEDIPLT